MRRSLRLPDFDYASAGAYFVTVTVHQRKALLGSLKETTGAVDLNAAGKMVDQWWLKLPQKFESVTLDAHVVMPDHLHGIVLLACSDHETDECAVSLSTVMQWLKSMTTTDYFRAVKSHAWPRVNGRVWQRGFHDHIVRTERDLLEIREYIQGNPGALFDRYAGRTHGSAPTTGRPETRVRSTVEE